MSFTIESLIVAIIAVLPGFVSAAVRATLKPGASPSAGEWVAGSIVASLTLNVLAFFLFIFWIGGVDLDQPIEQFRKQLEALPGRSTLYYLGLLYGLALLWGIASGLANDRLALRVLAYRLRLTPISPTANVLVDVLQSLVGSPENRRLRGKPEQQVAWLKLRRDGKVIQGQLRKSSVRFAVNEPLEVFLEPAYIRDGDVIIERADPNIAADSNRRLYLRLRPEDVVEILVMPADWDPVTAPQRPPPAQANQKMLPQIR